MGHVELSLLTSMALLHLHRVGRDSPQFSWLEPDRPAQLSLGRVGEDSTSLSLPFLHQLGSGQGKPREADRSGKTVRRKSESDLLGRSTGT